MTTQEQVDSFHRFAREQTGTGPSPLSLEELVEQWRIEQRPPDVAKDDVAAIREALEDMQAGDTGEPADAVLRQLREELDLAGRE